MRWKFAYFALFALAACSGSTGARRQVPVATPQAAGSDVVSIRSAAPAAPPSYDARLSAYTYPFEVKIFEFRSQAQSMQMAYMDEVGASPNGKTVLLFHGENFCSSYWRRTILSLTSQGYRVIAIDQLGFCKSSKPVTYQFSFATLASNTQRLLRELHILKVSVIGHSMGGMLAVRFALAYPQLMDRLILVSPLGLEDWQVKVPYLTIDETYSRELLSSVGDIKEYMRLNYYGGVWSPLYDEPLALIGGWMRGPDRKLFAWDRALASDMIFTQPVLQDLARLTPPTLLVIGQRDRTAIGRDRVPEAEAARLGDYPALGKSAAKAIPQAKLVELPLAGHLPQQDSFEAYIQAVERFLAGD